MKPQYPSGFCPRNLFQWAFLFFLFSLFSSPQLWAALQDAVKAGVVSRDLEKREESKIQKQNIPEIQVQEEEGAIAPESNEKVFIQAIRFKGNASLSEKKLRTLARPYIQKEQSLSDLRKLALTVQNYYRKKGYFLARVSIPPQEIDDGVLEMVISEGKVGKLTIRGNKRYKKDFIRRYFWNLDKGETIKYSHLLRPMMLLNENPSLQVSATLTKGEEPGTSDITLDVKEKFPIRTYFTYDNGGSDFVSKHRMGTAIEMDGLLFQGDRSSLDFVAGSPFHSLMFASANYSAPIDHSGARAEFGYQYSEFQAARELRDLGVEGRSQVFHTGLTQALLRTRSTRMDTGLSFDYKQIKNFILRSRVSDDELRVVNFDLSVDHVDKFHGHTYLNNRFSIALAGIMGATQSNSPAASRSKAGGPFLLYQPDFKRVQQLPWDTYLIGRFRGQIASDVLPASEEMVLGGIDTVRGYSQGEHLGDDGYIINVELRIPPPLIGSWEIPYLHQNLKSTLQLAGFFDHGTVFRRAASGQSPFDTIASVGMGLRFFLPHDWNVSLDWGFPISGNASSTGSVSEFYIKLNSRIL